MQTLLDFFQNKLWQSSYTTFLKYSRFTSSQGNNPFGWKMEAFHKAPLAVIIDEAPEDH